jgi:hypothetical protein
MGGDGRQGGQGILFAGGAVDAFSPVSRPELFAFGFGHVADDAGQGFWVSLRGGKATPMGLLYHSAAAVTRACSET